MGNALLQASAASAAQLQLCWEAIGASHFGTDRLLRNIESDMSADSDLGHR